MKKSLKHRLGRNLRALRASSGLAQEKLTEYLDVAPRYLAGIARGERNLTLDSIDAFADALRVDGVALPTVGVDDPNTVTVGVSGREAHGRVHDGLVFDGGQSARRACRRQR